MHRIPGKVAGSVAALAAVALLSACGGNDSTASQTPTLSSSASAAASATTQAPAPEGHGDHTSTPSEAPETSATAPEQPQAAPETTPQSAPASDKDKAFLAELSKNGITPASPDIALTAAGYICSSRATGASDADIAPYVAAIAGTDTAFDQSKMDVNKAAQIYIAAATTTYC
ncbi:DUF732 domain-containing protein [Nocardia asteroides]|uniref:DUF732 domain-containing protein n=1 Tax=Nocardia asteroides NBRC 15531 TaxID=1110697 RepID=U5EC09_NOCAS|nr:DUF732 domain-containing protein [Nocardia asteroides]TLF68930.1 DUF732 domain-containing protein [Nocardia asteroides NBRC 15531]UGT48397.1 DUF732 domain-containing protein [Nocardia asteroides]SFL58207.1 Protein of unknown function [Nocardia asteroides]VEG32357.1 Uncharacterised protein [Nocardia asteroides]GAD84895.1 hypothetical protein NCAST_25_03180 [Nocardia asteroides NBRC 15531]